ncbi:MAG: T9SS type A sorting domain-containing protein [Flavobacteriales bacterium]
MKCFLFLLLIFCSMGVFSQSPIGHTTLTFNDPNRTGGFGSGGGSGRQIQTEIYYPASSTGTNTPVANGAFPVIVFGHGFAMSWDAYNDIWEHLVPRGYIMAFVRTEGSLIPSPSHGDFGLDLSLVAQKMLELQTTSTLFQNHIYPKVGVMGHSMGGGASFLAASNNSNIQALIGLAPAETTPSAIAVAPNVLVPSIVFSGSSDGVTPPAQNHIPMFDGITSMCKSFVSITGGGHCYFANANFNCDFGESTSSTGISISRTQQQTTTFILLDPWLDFHLKDNCSAYELFQTALTSTTGINGQTTCPVVPNVVISQNGTILSTSTAGSSYQWYLNGVAIPGAIADYYDMGLQPGGVYQVQVTFPYGCGLSPNINVAGLENLNGNDLEISPNPAKDFMHIDQSNPTEIHVTIFDISGQKLGTFKLSETNNVIDVSAFHSGLYWLKLERSGTTYMKKCVIE